MGPELVPFMAMIDGVLITGMVIFGGVLVFRGPVGQALARRIQGRGGELEQELITETQALRDHVLALELQVGEMDERLDFSERLLARGRDAGIEQ